MKIMQKSQIALLCSVIGAGFVATSAVAGTVTTEGSTSMEKVIGVLSDSFHKANPKIEVTYSPTGSGAGITSVSEGRCDIGLSSRALKDAEKTKLNETVIALDGIVMIVNKANYVKDLTVDQIRSVYTGYVKNWKEVGGPDKPIVLIGREAGSGTRDGFESATDTKNRCLYRQELTSTGDVIATVAKNKNAIGYASLSAVSPKVKALTVNGVAATEKNILDQKYKLQRPFVFVTKRDVEPRSDVSAFILYATQGAAADLYKKAGVIPLK